MARDAAYQQAEEKIEAARQSGATELYLSQMKLTELPDSLGQLTQLQTLELSYNQLTALPESLGQLTQLQTLEVNTNRISSVPESFHALVLLDRIELGGNPLGRLPVFLRDLKKLKTLGAIRNELKSIPAWIGELASLELLAINGNQISSIPDSVSSLARLTEIWLDDNRISDLPPTLADLESLKKLKLANNPLNPELAAANDEGFDAVKSYLRAKAEDQIVLNEAKLILIGEGEVGKTSLLGAIRGDEWVENRPTTHGIEIKPVPVTDAETQTEITLNAWDFGGQPVYRPTHQLFFSAPAVYLVVWKPREGPHQGFVKEWIKLVKLREPDAKVLVVATHGGPGGRQPDLDRQEILDELGRETVLGFFHVESKPDDNGLCDGLEELKTAIACIAAGLPEVGRTVPHSWQKVRDALSRGWGRPQGAPSDDATAGGSQSSTPAPQDQQAPPAWMRHDEFVAFCSLHGGMDEGQTNLFTKISHTLGHLIHYDYDEDLKNIVILKPDWLATAISFVLDDRQTRENNGLVSFERLGHLWNDPERDADDRYPADLHAPFVRLMERFDLSYDVELPGDASRTILVSQLVPDKRPDLLPHWGERADAVDIEQRQICLIVDQRGQSATAEGLFYQLITRLHKYSLGRDNYHDSVHWQRGLMLDDDYNGRALLEHIGNDVRITVRAAFPERFLALLTAEVKWLVEDFWEGLRCDVMVPCTEPCGMNEPGLGLFEVRKLIAGARKGRHEYPCDVSGCEEWQDIGCLLRNAPHAQPVPDAIVTASIDDVMDELKVVRGELRDAKEAQEKEARLSLNRFNALHNTQKRLLSMIDDQFDGLLRMLVDEAKEGPRLFSLQPVKPEGIIKRLRKVGHETYQVTLWCEHARLPLPSLHEEDGTPGVYEISIPNEWLVGAASFLSKLNTTLSLVLPVAASGAKLFLSDTDYKQIGEQLDFNKSVISSLVSGGNTIGSLMSAGDAPENRMDVREEATRADGSTLRQLHAFLAEKDPSKGFGGLVRVQNKRREFLWVHPQFVSEY